MASEIEGMNTSSIGDIEMAYPDDMTEQEFMEMEFDEAEQNPEIFRV